MFAVDAPLPDMKWAEEMAQGILIRIKVQPRGRLTQIVGLWGHPPRLKIKLHAPPVDGKANEELLQFLKQALGTTLANLKIVRGEKSSQKDVLCCGVTLATVKNLLVCGVS